MSESIHNSPEEIAEQKAILRGHMKEIRSEFRELMMGIPAMPK